MLADVAEDPRAWENGYVLETEQGVIP